MTYDINNIRQYESKQSKQISKTMFQMLNTKDQDKSQTCYCQPKTKSHAEDIVF